MINLNHVTSMGVMGGKIFMKTADGESHSVTPPYPYEAKAYFETLKERVEYIKVGGI